jgi:hypothetical protein
MKTRTLLTLILTLAMSVAKAQDEPAQAMVFETYEWDFGEINEADGTVYHTFRFMNISNNPIQIDNVATSCGCTTVLYSTQPVAGGEYGEITVAFDPSRFEGHILREVEVLTKDRRNYASIMITADVIPIPMGLEQIYPYLLAGTIKTNAKSCPFGYVTQGDAVTKVVRIANVGDKSVKLSVQTTGDRYGMSVQCPQEIAPQEVVSIKVTYDIPTGKNSFGEARDTIWVVADGAKSETPIVARALRVEKFSNDENAPKPFMRIEPSYVDFGEQAPGKIYKKTIVIENTGNADLIFRNVETTDGVAASIKTGDVIKPGKIHKKTVTVAIANSREPHTVTMGSINLTTNDPTRPFRELRLEVDTK